MWRVHTLQGWRKKRLRLANMTASRSCVCGNSLGVWLEGREASCAWSGKWGAVLGAVTVAKLEAGIWRCFVECCRRWSFIWQKKKKRLQFAQCTCSLCSTHAVIYGLLGQVCYSCNFFLGPICYSCNLFWTRDIIFAFNKWITCLILAVSFQNCVIIIAAFSEPFFFFFW